MNLLHRATFIVRKALVIIIAFGLWLPLSALINWLAPNDWHPKHGTGE